MAAEERKYIVLAGSISLDGATYQQGEEISAEQIRGRTFRLLQMGVIRLISPEDGVENTGSTEA